MGALTLALTILMIPTPKCVGECVCPVGVCEIIVLEVPLMCGILTMAHEP